MGPAAGRLSAPIGSAHRGRLMDRVHAILARLRVLCRRLVDALVGSCSRLPIVGKPRWARCDLCRRGLGSQDGTLRYEHHVLDARSYKICLRERCLARIAAMKVDRR